MLEKYGAFEDEMLVIERQRESTNHADISPLGRDEGTTVLRVTVFYTTSRRRIFVR